MPRKKVGAVLLCLLLCSVLLCALAGPGCSGTDSAASGRPDLPAGPFSTKADSFLTQIDIAYNEQTVHHLFLKVRKTENGGVRDDFLFFGVLPGLSAALTVLFGRKKDTSAFPGSFHQIIDFQHNQDGMK